MTGNEFAYCGNDPVNYVDPTGFMNECYDGGGGDSEGYEGSGFVESFIEIVKENNSTPYKAVNYWTGGALDDFVGAVNPDKPLSAEHWADSAKTAIIVFPIIMEATTILKKLMFHLKL